MWEVSNVTVFMFCYGLDVNGKGLVTRTQRIMKNAGVEGNKIKMLANSISVNPVRRSVRKRQVNRRLLFDAGDVHGHSVVTSTPMHHGVVSFYFLLLLSSMISFTVSF